MKLNRPGTIIPVLLILTLIGCSIACNLLSPPVLSGQPLFQDDFSSPASGWSKSSSPTLSMDYLDGSFRIHVKGPGMDAWSTPGVDLGDVSLYTDVEKLPGPDGNTYGLICRYRDPENFYFFLISDDGYASIGRYSAGQRILLSHETMLPVEAIHRGDQRNNLQADCIQSRLTFYVNGSFVAEVEDTSYATGDVGFIAGTTGQPGSEILFDNFFAIKP